MLAKYAGVNDPERLFVAGLIHDIGRLALYKYKPVPASETLRLALETNCFVYDMEYEVMGIRHTTVGKMLMQKWKLPVSIENMITYHHKPMASKNPLEPAIINVADWMAIAMNMGTSGERLLPCLDPEVWKCLELPVSIFAPVVKQTKRQLKEVMRSFEK